MNFLILTFSICVTRMIFLFHIVFLCKLLSLMYPACLNSLADGIPYELYLFQFVLQLSLIGVFCLQETYTRRISTCLAAG